ncbi:MAG: hypothetical protein ACM3Q1_04065 [Bacteroidales bacterium]
MLRTCPYCGGPVPSHGTCCRVPDDLDRFERVFERLTELHDNDFLRENLMRYLVAYGRRSNEDFDAFVQPFRGSVNSATRGAW